MATYYKYAERKASDEINWAEVGKNLTDMLKEENKIREDKKAKIDEDSRQFGETLANAPTGESETARAWALKYGDDAQQARLLQDRLLKSGQLKLRDYTIMRQNLTDGTTAAFDYIKEYQQVYKEKMDRALAGQSQQWEQFQMQMAAEGLDFANTALYINPTNYQVSVGKKNADGSMSTNPNDFHNINDLRNYTKQNYDYFNSDEATTKFVDGLGDYQTIEQVYGGISILSDTSTRQGQNFDNLMKKRFESFGAGNPFNFTSILTNDIGGYGFTLDANEAANDPTKILMKKSNANGPLVPDFSTANGQKQKDAIYEHLKLQTISKIDTKRTYTQKTVTYAPSHIVEAGQNKKKVQDAAGILAMLYGGASEAEVNASMENIGGLGNIYKIDRQGTDKVIFHRKFQKDDGTFTETQEEVKLSASDGSPVGLENFITGGLNKAFKDFSTFGVSKNEYMKNVNKKKYGNLANYSLTVETTMPASQTKAKKFDYNESYNNFVDESLAYDPKAPSGLLFDENNDESAVVASLIAQFGGLGFKFEGSGYTSDYVTVYKIDDKGEKVKGTTFEFPVNDASGSAKSPEKLRNYIKTNSDEKVREAAFKNKIIKGESESGGVMSEY